MKKITSVLLALVMLFTMSMTALATDEISSLKASAISGNGTVVVKISATEATTNGKFVVEFDQNCLTYVSCEVEGVLTHVSESTDSVTIIYATTSAQAVAAGEMIIKVRFAVSGSWTITNIPVIVKEFNSNESLNDEIANLIVMNPNEGSIPTPPAPSVPDEEVTTNPDGSTTTTTTDKEGNVTETTETTDGTTATTVTDKNGNVTEVKAEISEEAAEAEVVTLPVEVKIAESAEEAVPVEITVPESVESVTVEIPVEDVSAGTVIVVVYPDGTEKVLSATAMTEDGLAITVEGDVTVKVVDNTKEFVDDDMWAQEAITFVTSREIFNGTGEDTFSPDQSMTRAMLMTVLARLDGVDTNGGATWYEIGMNWAKANGVSDGTNPNGNISREQLATMLYRYAGEPATSGSLAGFTDAGEVSGYAEAALKWAVENGIINGMGDGTLNPKGEATRAQLAKILMYFING